MGLFEERDWVWGFLERRALSRGCGVGGVDGGVDMGEGGDEMGFLRFMGLAIDSNVDALRWRRCIQRQTNRLVDDIRDEKGTTEARASSKTLSS